MLRRVGVGVVISVKMLGQVRRDSGDAVSIVTLVFVFLLISPPSISFVDEDRSLKR